MRGEVGTEMRGDAKRCERRNIKRGEGEARRSSVRGEMI